MKKTMLVVAVLLTASSLHAGTAFLTGERTVGMTKTCFYDYLGSPYTKTMSSVSLCPISITVRDTLPTNPAPVAPATEFGIEGTAFYKGEETAGMTKICYYDFLGSEYTKTVSSVAICPISLRIVRR